MIIIDDVIIREYDIDGFMYRADKEQMFACFDIETTLLDLPGEEYPQAIMYIWQFCIGNNNWRDIYIGRCWEDFKLLVSEIADLYHLGGKYNLLPCYVHNLGYEFQWLRSVFKITDMFAVKTRVPVRFTADDAFSFRCSYRLSNMSLAKLCKQENAKHGKRTRFDYNKKRFPDTPLSDDELIYCVDDVLGLHESICSLMTGENDTLRTIPFTSTGYVRREAREKVLSNPKNKMQVKDMELTPDDYFLCKAAARGGNTHCFYEYAGQILEDIYSDDLASSYPHQMVTKDFPVGAWCDDRSKDIIADACNLLHVVFYDLLLNKNITVPYIARGKCQHCGGVIEDNGRILKADYAEMVITEIDFDIIKRQYQYSDLVWVAHKVAEKGKLCDEYRDFVKYMFEQKCRLKKADPYFYAKYKNKINALFGMMLTDITRPEIMYSEDTWKELYSDCAVLLKEYYDNRKTFLNYQQGIYVTANARAALQAGLDRVGLNAVYCDTDSIKHFENMQDVFNDMNKQIIAFNIANGWPGVTVDGKTYHCGIWEHDEEYSRFITWGAKKYAYEYKRPEDHGGHKYGVTVAGLNKEKGAAVLEKEGLEAFDLDRVFNEQESGRLTAHYNDLIRWEQLTYKGHKIELTSNIALLPTTYTLGITANYEQLIKNEIVWR